MTVKEVIDGFREGAEENAERDAYAGELFQEAIRIGMELNNQYHTPEEILEIMGRLTGKKMDDTFRLFPPFYTDFGKNITIGKDVFINSGCHFQDQGGIEIGDGALIGHNVVLATINHDLDPKENRKNHYAPIKIGAHVWIGSNVTILPGVTIGDWAVVAAGAVVTRDVSAMTVVGGVPAKVLRRVQEEKREHYESEESVGEAVRNSGIPREEIFVITKLYPSQFSDPEAAIEEALAKLDIDYIDMMLLHHPGAGDVDAYLAMENAVADGKIRSLGLSNWYVEELEEFLPQINIMPALVQNEIHSYYQENDVIPGSSNPDHIQENTELFDFELTEEEMEQINALDRNEKHDWY